MKWKIGLLASLLLLGACSKADKSGTSGTNTPPPAPPAPPAPPTPIVPVEITSCGLEGRTLQDRISDCAAKVKNSKGGNTGGNPSDKWQLVSCDTKATSTSDCVWLAPLDSSSSKRYLWANGAHNASAYNFCNITTKNKYSYYPFINDNTKSRSGDKSTIDGNINDVCASQAFWNGTTDVCQGKLNPYFNIDSDISWRLPSYDDIYTITSKDCVGKGSSSCNPNGFNAFNDKSGIPGLNSDIWSSSVMIDSKISSPAAGWVVKANEYTLSSPGFGFPGPGQHNLLCVGTYTGN